MINCVYIHIPFCEKKCNYCAFCSFELTKYKEEYLNSLTKEIEYFYKNEPLKTLYFGGGTPSLLETKDFKRILSLFNFNSNTETTLELNPSSLTLEKLKDLKELGFNRLSLGVQSFDDEILKIIGRTHNRVQTFSAIENIKKAGFDNFSIDLMYGLPNQTLSDWEKTLKQAILLEPKHISLYGLKIEEGTVFYKKPPENLPNMDIQALMYEKAVEKLKEKYIHYEFSNFALSKKYFSCHNTAYWSSKEYYGFGLSASGYIDNKRYTNTFNFSQYIKNPITKNFDELTKEEKIEEEIFLGLRLIKGIDFKKINEKYQIDIYSKYKKEFDKFLNLKLLEKTNKGVKLSEKGILVSNEVLCEFINV